MKKEFGKWLMDIAKYMTTALLLSTIFADMSKPKMIFLVVGITAAVLVLGLYWVKIGNKQYTEKVKTRKR